MNEGFGGGRASRCLGAVAAVVMLAAPWRVYAQVPAMAQAQVPGQAPDAAARDAAEQRRAQQRDMQMRMQQERGPDVRLDAAAPRTASRLPESESPCFRIGQLELIGEEAGRFAWVMDAVAGPGADDSPLRKCLGTAGVDLVLQRAQEALRERGYVTTRVLAQRQQLASGTLSLSVLPGRVREVRFAGEPGQRATTWNTVTAKPGDILNLHDIEQSLENFRRVPTVQADIRVESAEHAGPALSDLVISHAQPAAFRFSVSADDSGTRSTGRRQGAITLSHDNWWTLSDLFYITLNHDLGGGDAGYRGTRGGTVHYSVPLGNWMLGATFSRNRYAQTVAGATQDYVYSGTSRNAELKLSRVIHRSARSRTTASLKAFQRLSSSFIDDTEVQVQRRAVGGWELGMGHRELAGPVVLEGSVNYRRGTGAFGSQPAPEDAFGEGTSRFALVTADASIGAPFELAGQRQLARPGPAHPADTARPLRHRWPLHRAWL